MDDKIIVSNRSALAAKYGSQGVARIKGAVGKLIAADKKRGIGSRLVYLDDAKVMKKLGASAVVDRRSARQNKEAIDAIYRATTLEYLLILGSTDVIPHQDMSNPMFDPPDDEDRYAYGDLPYACDAGYARDVAKFKGPTRVVGRLPDLTGAREPSHLLALLGVATKFRTRRITDYASYFGLSTESWSKSTEQSLFNVFGNATAINIAPPRGPSHPASRLAAHAHFINCHGGKADPSFYGEDAKETEQPESLTSHSIKGKIKSGTVAAVECCYGAELYDSVTLSLSLPICQHYLRQGAYAYFGSSTIAYGPPEGNGAADLITQYFLLSILEGASVGRAALAARQRFVQQTSELDPADLKTLAQFSLLGDPSIHPAKLDTPTSVPRGMEIAVVHRRQRQERREKLRAMGDFLQDTKPTASRKVRDAQCSTTVRSALANIAREAGIGVKKEFTAFDVAAPRGARRRGAKLVAMASRYYVAVYRPKRGSGGSVAAVAKEVGGRIVGYRIYREK